MSKIVIGIDPGLNGGIAIYNSIDESINVFVMPIIKTKVQITKKKSKEERTIDTLGISSLLSPLISDKYELCIYIEDVHSIFGVSAKSNFSFGYGYGKLHSAIEGMSLTWNNVQPKKWQKHVWIEKDIVKEPDNLVLNKKNEIVTKKGKVDTKATSLNSILRLYPEINLKASSRCKIDHDGIVDALAIMTYGLIQEKLTK